MSDADALLDAIFAAPADDTPRLVYADYVQEHGQENYAQFLRLQCAAARCEVWSDEANELWERIGRVWNRLSDEWWPATVDAWPGIPCCHGNAHPLDAVHFERGFLRDAIHLTLDQLVRYAGTCWPWLPLPVTHLAADGEADVGAAHFPRLSRVRRLRLRTWWTHEREVSRLLGSPFLSNLEVLDATDGALSHDQVEALLRPGAYPALRATRLVVYDHTKSDYPDEHRLLRHLSADEFPSRPLRDLRNRLEARFDKVSIRFVS